jgi:hypothetical protein
MNVVFEFARTRAARNLPGRSWPALLIFFALAAHAADLRPPVQDWFPKAPPLPPPSGEILRVSTVKELFAAAEQVPPGGTILLADGHYFMPRWIRPMETCGSPRAPPPRWGVGNVCQRLPRILIGGRAVPAPWISARTNFHC